MQEVLDEFQALIALVIQLRQIDEHTAAIRPGPGKWSRKEILGHLIDSAANNHQRFVRMQLSARLDLPGYQQEKWLRVQH